MCVLAQVNCWRASARPCQFRFMTLGYVYLSNRNPSPLTSIMPTVWKVRPTAPNGTAFLTWSAQSACWFFSFSTNSPHHPTHTTSVDKRFSLKHSTSQLNHANRQNVFVQRQRQHSHIDVGPGERRHQGAPLPRVALHQAAGFQCLLVCPVQVRGRHRRQQRDRRLQVVLQGWHRLRGQAGGAQRTSHSAHASLAQASRAAFAC